jgi:CRISPR/Cas system-associated endoribonuclease Cas2
LRLNCINDIYAQHLKYAKHSIFEGMGENSLNKILKEQLQELQQEISQIDYPFKRQLNLDATLSGGYPGYQTRYLSTPGGATGIPRSYRLKKSFAQGLQNP